MSFTYRKATEADRAKYVDFANYVFSNAHRPHDFQDLIPKMYAPGRKNADKHNIAVNDEGDIRGMVAVMPNDMYAMGEELKYGYVGTVSVHPYARGEGHMKKLMAMAIDGMINDGIDIAMLGGQRQRYEYFGFTLGGVERVHRVTSTNLRHVLGNVSTDNICISDVNANDADMLAKCAALNMERRLYARRMPEEFYIIAITWNNVLKAVSIDGEFAGYMIVKGGSVSELMLKNWNNTAVVLKKYMQIAGDSVELATGDSDLELNRILAQIEERKSFSNAVMLRVYNFPKVIGALMRLKASYAPMENAARSFVIDGQPLTISVKNGEVKVLAEAPADAAEISAMDAQRMFFCIDGELTAGSLPLGWAPLPLFIPAADHF